MPCFCLEITITLTLQFFSKGLILIFLYSLGDLLGALPLSTISIDLVMKFITSSARGTLAGFDQRDAMSLKMTSETFYKSFDA
jgi:hypothetical protein